MVLFTFIMNQADRLQHPIIGGRAHRVAMMKHLDQLGSAMPLIIGHLGQRRRARSHDTKLTAPTDNIRRRRSDTGKDCEEGLAG